MPESSSVQKRLCRGIQQAAPTLYSPLTSCSLLCMGVPAGLGGRLGALLPPLLLLAALPPPACILTFMVSRGWMVLCEAARAMAPATTSCAGLPSGAGGGGGGATGAAATAAGAARVAELLAAAAADTAPSLPVGCMMGTAGGKAWQRSERQVPDATAPGKKRRHPSKQARRSTYGGRQRQLNAPGPGHLRPFQCRPVPYGAPSLLLPRWQL